MTASLADRRLAAGLFRRRLAARLGCPDATVDAPRASTIAFDRTWRTVRQAKSRSVSSRAWACFVTT